MNPKNLAETATSRLTGEQASKYLGISVSTLEKMRHEGRGPRFLRLGRRVQYRKADLDLYVESRVVETTDSRAA